VDTVGRKKDKLPYVPILLGRREGGNEKYVYSKHPRRLEEPWVGLYKGKVHRRTGAVLEEFNDVADTVQLKEGLDHFRTFNGSGGRLKRKTGDMGWPEKGKGVGIAGRKGSCWKNIKSASKLY